MILKGAKRVQAIAINKHKVKIPVEILFLIMIIINRKKQL